MDKEQIDQAYLKTIELINNHKLRIALVAFALLVLSDGISVSFTSTPRYIPNEYAIETGETLFCAMPDGRMVSIETSVFNQFTESLNKGLPELFPYVKGTRRLTIFTHRSTGFGGPPKEIRSDIFGDRAWNDELVALSNVLEDFPEPNSITGRINLNGTTSLSVSPTPIGCGTEPSQVFTNNAEVIMNAQRNSSLSINK